MINYAAAIPHTSGVPVHTPSLSGSMLAYDVAAKVLYKWNGATWEQDSTDVNVTFTAGETLSTGRVVVIDSGTAVYFQPSDPGHAGRAYGVTVTSATVGNDVLVKPDGEVTDAAFTFAVDSMLWVGANGEIFDTPQAGVLQKAGISIGVDRMKIDFSIQIIQI